MPEPINKKLYNEVIKDIDKIYTKPSAYRSGAIVKEYKKRGGLYKSDGNEPTLKRWFSESWTDISGPNQYPVLRPSIRINSHTPKTINEIPTKRLKEQVKLKQKIKGGSNLPKF